MAVDPSTASMSPSAHLDTETYVADPDVAGAEDGYAVAVACRPQADMVLRVPDDPPGSLDDVLDAYPVDDHVADELQGDPGAARDEDVGSIPCRRWSCYLSQ